MATPKVVYDEKFHKQLDEILSSLSRQFQSKSSSVLAAAKRRKEQYEKLLKALTRLLEPGVDPLDVLDLRGTTPDGLSVYVLEVGPWRARFTSDGESDVLRGEDIGLR
jgi:hypothetical protein